MSSKHRCCYKEGKKKECIKRTDQDICTLHSRSCFLLCHLLSLYLSSFDNSIHPSSMITKLIRIEEMVDVGGWASSERANTFLILMRCWKMNYSGNLPTRWKNGTSWTVWVTLGTADGSSTASGRTRRWWHLVTGAHRGAWGGTDSATWGFSTPKYWNLQSMKIFVFLDDLFSSRSMKEWNWWEEKQRKGEESGCYCNKTV